MAFCTECGTKGNGGKFCVQCGHKFSNAGGDGGAGGGAGGRRVQKPRTGAVRKASWLHKTGNGTITRNFYKKRWCVLEHGGTFAYFKKNDDAVPTGSFIIVKGSSVGLTVDNGMAFTFELRPNSNVNGRIYRMACDTEQELSSWMAAFQAEGSKRVPSGPPARRGTLILGDGSSSVLAGGERGSTINHPPPGDGAADDAMALSVSPAVSPGMGRRGSSVLAFAQGCTPKAQQSKIRGLVSKKKIRFQAGGYDLDLAYVGERRQLIAMGFPSEGLEGQYRNPMDRVQHFFKEYHDGAFRVYNLCSEREYPAGTFPSQVHFPFDDHNPPPFKVMVDCCKDVKAYISKSANNVAAIHCKAGKGRTGTIIAAVMQVIDEGKDANEALNKFGQQRTQNNKGVTIPSQQRYVRYFEAWNARGQSMGLEEYQYPLVTIKGFNLTHAPNFDFGGGCDPYFKLVSFDGKELYNMKKDKSAKITAWKKDKEATRRIPVDIAVRGDFKIIFYDEDTIGKDDKMFALCMNTGFLHRNSYIFSKLSLDGAVKDKKHHIFHKDFTCEVIFEGVADVVPGNAPDENNTPFVPIANDHSSEEEDDENDEGNTPQTRLDRQATSKTKTNFVKGLVSKKKLRFQQDGFDLDLSYINPQVIAMGFPSEGFEGTYRNKMADVQRFFNEYHAGTFKVYNLCSEREYAAGSFPHMQHYPFDDHNPPPFQVMVDFCRDARQHIDTSPDHLVAVHCKAGKGRTGTVVAALFCEQEADAGQSAGGVAETALNMFGTARTKNNKGVTIPSQQRYVRYYAAFLSQSRKPGKPFSFDYPEVTIKHITLTHPPDFDVGGGCDPYFKILSPDGTTIYNMKKDKTAKIVSWRKEHHRDLPVNIKIRGDVKIVFYDEDKWGKDDKMFALWVNTAFLRRTKYVWHKASLDGAVKDKKHEVFNEKFQIEMDFTGAGLVVGSPEDEPDVNNTPFFPHGAEGSTDEDREDKEEAPRKRKKKKAGMLGRVRGLVSKKKTRFKKGGFDLDLSYITPGLIAMGFPSSGLEGAYRNKMLDAQKFFAQFHDCKYKVYNLCSERDYNMECFYKAGRFPFDDHNPPAFRTMIECCNDVDEFLQSGDHHVAALHCKAGKGRTGTIIAAYMQIRLAGSAEEALNMFGTARTSNNKGVTIPSQQRFVRYYGAYLNEYVRPGKPFSTDHYPIVVVKSVRMRHAPNFDVGGGCDPYFKLLDAEGGTIFNYKKDYKIKAWKKELECTLKLSKPLAIRGDVKFVFYDKDTMGKDDKMFSLWLNTAFLRRRRYTFKKMDLDSACKDKHCKHYHEDFEMEIEFEGEFPAYTDDGEEYTDENNTTFVPEPVAKGVKAAEEGEEYSSGEGSE